MNEHKITAQGGIDHRRRRWKFTAGGRRQTALRPLFALIALITAALSLQGCAGVFVAGAATGASVAGDRRNAETMLEDQAIELKATNRIFADDELKHNTHINVTSVNHVVLLTGEAATKDLRKRIVHVVKGIEGIRHVHNEIAIAQPSSLASRSKDAWITTKAKSILLGSKGISGLRTKVVTERGNVYLMGLATREEGRNAAAAVKDLDGVEKVVKVFEYID